MMPARWPIILLMALPLAACGGASVVPPQPSYAPAPAGPPASAFAKPGPLTGLDARRLIQQFGTPRLDIREQTMRKLQFANGRCVLDAYLYPPAKGKDPVVTYVDARAPTGADVDPAGCVLALQAK